MVHTSPELRNLLAWLHLLAQPGTLFRGEAECFDRVSSGLYRQLYAIDDEGFDIMAAQQRQLEETRNYSSLTDDADLLTNIQHLGGKTNLIDFTRDLNIALFFASNYAPDQDGRVILFNPRETLRLRGSDEFKIIQKGTPSNMADVQKSVWIIPKRGYISERDMAIVTIPRALKHEITEHLKTLHGVEQATVYNDISGFIRDQESFWDHDAELGAGWIAFNARRYKQAIQHFARLIELSSAGRWPKSLHPTHHLKALAHWQIGEREEALSHLEQSQRWQPRMEGLPRIPELDALLEQRKREREQQQELERERSARRKTDSSHVEILRFMIQARSAEGAGRDAQFVIASEFGYSYRQQVAADGNLLVTVPNGTEQGQWRLWFTLDGYRGVHGMQREWPVHETVRLESYTGASDVLVNIESRRYHGEDGKESEAWRNGEWIPLTDWGPARSRRGCGIIVGSRHARERDDDRHLQGPLRQRRPDASRAARSRRGRGGDGVARGRASGRRRPGRRRRDVGDL